MKSIFTRNCHIAQGLEHFSLFKDKHDTQAIERRIEADRKREIEYKLQFDQAYKEQKAEHHQSKKQNANDQRDAKKIANNQENEKWKV